jgi:hypothetical protein
MGNWYMLNLGDGIMATMPSDQIRDRFLRLFAEAGKPPDMAVFTRLESEGRLHCEVIAYFSPTAVRVAEEFDAQPCEKPARTGLGLLAGEAYSWSVLFPESPE